jgi:hypothetical protein
MNEAFVYMWYVAPTGKFYIGYSSDSPNSYTHSSSVEEFLDFVPNSKSRILERKGFLSDLPKGVRRRILARGKKEEMRELETDLQRNRYDRGKWDKYYNVNVGQSFPVDINVTHGKLKGSRSDDSGEIQRQYVIEKRKDPEYKAEENRKQKEKKRQERKDDPEKVRARDNAYLAKNREKINTQRRTRRTKKKLEKQQSQSSLDTFFG